MKSEKTKKTSIGFNLPSELEGYNGNLLAYAITPDYLSMLQLSLQSLRLTYPEHPPILVMLSGSSPKGLARKLKMQPRTYFAQAKLPPEFIGPKMGHLPSYINPEVFYSRLLLWTSVFDQFDKILFLDADTLLIRSVGEIFDNDQFYITRDVYEGPCGIVDDADAQVQGMLKDDGVNLPLIGANGGVFLLPLKYRTGQYRESLFAILARYRPHLKWADQTLINIWMASHKIPPQKSFDYNAQTRLCFGGTNCKIDEENIRVLHLNAIGGLKRKLLMQVIAFLQQQGASPQYLCRFLSRTVPTFFHHPDD